MSFVLSTVMDAIAQELVNDGVATRVYAWPVGNAIVPAAVVGWPTQFEYDYTAHAIGTTGKIRAVFPVRFIVGRDLDKSTRDGLSAIVTGNLGVPESLGGNLAGAVDTCNVNSLVRFETERIADVDYAVVVFEVEVIA